MSSDSPSPTGRRFSAEEPIKMRICLSEEQMAIVARDTEGVGVPLVQGLPGYRVVIHEIHGNGATISYEPDPKSRSDAAALAGIRTWLEQQRIAPFPDRSSAQLWIEHAHNAVIADALAELDRLEGR